MADRTRDQELAAADAGFVFMSSSKTPAWVSALARAGVRVKTFQPLGGHDFSEYFRVTVGLPAENDRFPSALSATCNEARMTSAA